jgi:hypothetical protein
MYVYDWGASFGPCTATISDLLCFKFNLLDCILFHYVDIFPFSTSFWRYILIGLIPLGQLFCSTITFLLFYRIRVHLIAS